MDAVYSYKLNSSIMQYLWIIINWMDRLHSIVNSPSLKKWFTNGVWVICVIGTIYSAVTGRSKVTNHNNYDTYYVVSIHSNCDSTKVDYDTIKMAVTLVKD